MQIKKSMLLVLFVVILTPSADSRFQNELHISDYMYDNASIKHENWLKRGGLLGNGEIVDSSIDAMAAIVMQKQNATSLDYFVFVENCDPSSLTAANQNFIALDHVATDYVKGTEKTVEELVDSAINYLKKELFLQVFETVVRDVEIYVEALRLSFMMNVAKKVTYYNPEIKAEDLQFGLNDDGNILVLTDKNGVAVDGRVKDFDIQIWDDNIINKLHGGVYNCFGASYSGGIESGLPCGRGVKRLRNESGVVDGDFVDGEINGMVKCNRQNGSKCSGEFRNGEPYGQTTLEFPSGNVFVGTWKKEFRDGIGIMKYAGQDHKCYWENGRLQQVNQMNLRQQDMPYRQNGLPLLANDSLITDFDDKGTVLDKNLELVTGRVENLKFFTLRYVDSETLFSGEIRNGKLCRGIIKYNSGDEYDLYEYNGELQGDVFHGVGTFISVKYFSSNNETNTLLPITVTYHGEWINGKRHGEGVEESTDGSSYAGGWENDKREGDGVERIKEDFTYTGHFHNDLKHGHGIEKYMGDSYGNEYLYDGEWLCGVKHGYGKMTYAQPKISDENGILKPMEKEHWYQESYEGMWENGMQHGSGVLLFSNGGSYKGEFKNGRYNGHGVMMKEYRGCTYYGNEQILPHESSYTGEWLDGERHGYGESDEILYYNFNGGEAIPCRMTYKGVWKDNNYHGIGTAVYQNGDVYDGEWDNGQRSGQGKLTCPNGDMYDGEWQNNDLQNGNVKFTCSGGDVYEGEFKNGKRSGRVRLTCSNGDVHEGEWYSDFWDNWEKVEFIKYADKVTVRYENGSLYEGEWKDGQKHGIGKLMRPNGDIYEGAWNDGQMHGTGKFTYSNGDVYEGAWNNGQRSGQGKYMYSTNGDVYEGEWNDGQKHGIGKLMRPNGDIYEGAWNDGQMHGIGKLMCLINGDVYEVYEGEWKDGQKHGIGKLIYPNCEVYEGQWKDGQKHGTGKFTYSNGEVYEGQWKDNNYHGIGTAVYQNGDVYEGAWNNGQRSGQGKYMYSTNGDVYEGEWNDGQKHGIGKLMCLINGDVYEVYEGEWKDGQKHGIGKLMRPNGDIYEGAWNDGQRSGQGKLTHTNGDVYEGAWYNDKLNGKVCIYDNKAETKNTYFFKGIDLNGSSKKANLFMALFGNKTQKPEDTAQNVFEEIQSLFTNANRQWEERRLEIE